MRAVHDMRMKVRSGLTRHVLLAGRWAVKVPRVDRGVEGFARGILANASEAMWSGDDGFCPVLLSIGGLVNVYPRCEPVDEFDGDYATIASTRPPTDPKPHNLGRLDGQIVWVDYDLSWNDCRETCCSGRQAVHNLIDEEL